MGIGRGLNEEIKITTEDDGAGGRVLTVFFMGTCSRKGDRKNTKHFPRDKGEIVASTLSKVIGEKNVDYAFANGPGTDDNDEHGEGEYENGAKSDRNERWAKPTSSSHIKQVFLGHGIKENIDHVMAVINGERTWWPEHDAEHNQPFAGRTLAPITKVNFVGWSRGAAAAIEAANRIYDLQKAEKKKRKKHRGRADWAKTPFEQIKEINICAIDPVAGFGSTHAKNTTLCPLVKNYLGIYALDERSYGFSPIFPQKSPKSKTNMQFMFEPGHHCTVAGGDKLHNGNPIAGTVQNAIGVDQPIDLSGVGDVVRDTVEKFLLKHGTNLDRTKTCNYTRQELIALYEKIKVNLPAYELLRNGAYTIRQLSDYHRKFIVYGNLISNVVAHQLPDYQKDEAERKKGYVNAHHAQLVREELRSVYGNYGSYIEHLQIIKYQLSIYMNHAKLNTKTPYLKNAGFITTLKNLSRRQSRKQNCDKVINSINTFIEEFSQSIASQLSAPELDKQFLSFSRQLKEMASTQIKAINKERNLFKSDYASLLANLVLSNTPWTKPYVRSIFAKPRPAELSGSLLLKTMHRQL